MAAPMQIASSPNWLRKIADFRANPSLFFSNSKLSENAFVMDIHKVSEVDCQRVFDLKKFKKCNFFPKFTSGLIILMAFKTDSGSVMPLRKAHVPLMPCRPCRKLC